MDHIDQLFTDIAREHLFIETLDTRKSDSLDFHDVAVWGVRAALAAAYEAGRQAPAFAEMLAALILAQEALNTAARFRVGDTDSYRIASIVDRAIAKARAA